MAMHLSTKSSVSEVYIAHNLIICPHNPWLFLFLLTSNLQRSVCFSSQILLCTLNPIGVFYVGNTELCKLIEDSMSGALMVGFTSQMLYLMLLCTLNPIRVFYVWPCRTLQLD